ncbi:MAG: hypothetical protein J7J36_01950 [Thermoplasmata archaeon]|nr:hypothetical protein [Thermoplasmata archaeon]
MGNRFALIRVPKYEEEKEKSMGIGFRSPDPSTNPYLAMASVITAELKGIEEKGNRRLQKESRKK